MKYTKKMIVVPYIQATIEDPKERYIVDLDNEMSQILSKRDSNVDEKVKLYLQTLVKFKEKYEPSITMNQAVGNIRTDISEFVNAIKNPIKSEPIEPIKSEPIESDPVQKKLKPIKRVKFNETPKRKLEDEEDDVFQTPGKFTLNLSDSLIDEDNVTNVLKNQIKDSKSDYLKEDPPIRRYKKPVNYNENALRQSNETDERAKEAWGEFNKQIKKNDKGEYIIPKFSDFKNWITK